MIVIEAMVIAIEAMTIEIEAMTTGIADTETAIEVMVEIVEVVTTGEHLTEEVMIEGRTDEMIEEMILVVGEIITALRVDGVMVVIIGDREVVPDLKVALTKLRVFGPTVTEVKRDHVMTEVVVTKAGRRSENKLRMKTNEMS